MDFKITADFVPTGDQPEAIKQLVRGLNDNTRYQTLLGVTGSGKTFTIANVIQEIKKPTLNKIVDPIDNSSLPTFVVFLMK